MPNRRLIQKTPSFSRCGLCNLFRIIQMAYSCASRFPACWPAQLATNQLMLRLHRCIRSNARIHGCYFLCICVSVCVPVCWCCVFTVTQKPKASATPFPTLCVRVCGCAKAFRTMSKPVLIKIACLPRPVALRCAGVEGRGGYC